MTCWPRYLLWLVITVIGSSNLISACGQKGPLFLPEPEQQEDAETTEPVS